MPSYSPREKATAKPQAHPVRPIQSQLTLPQIEYPLHPILSVDQRIGDITSRSHCGIYSASRALKLRYPSMMDYECYLRGCLCSHPNLRLFTLLIFVYAIHQSVGFQPHLCYTFEHFRCYLTSRFWFEHLPSFSDEY